MIPDKLYVREYPDRVNQFWDREKRDGVVAVIYHEYIRKDALLEWAENMKRICKGVEPIEKVYQTMIDKIESL